MGQANITSSSKGTSTQLCESCHQHHVLIHLWDYVATGEGKWFCTLCLVPAIYADAVRMVEEERDRRARALQASRDLARRRGVAEFAFAPGLVSADTDTALHSLAQKLQRRPRQLLGSDGPKPRFKG
jgi:hypothetical protein